jgi:putative two-component system response regulator
VTPTPSTILIVDDEPANLSVLSQLLSPVYRVLASKTGMQALQSSSREPVPDLILLDVMMPGMDGYAVLARLKENEKTRDIPVIFVTALNDQTDEEHGLALGAVDYIAKPIKPAIVKARVRAHLEIKHSRDRLRDQNCWLEEEVARRMHENILIQDISMNALAGLAEVRDPETGNHILRTQGYVEELGRRLMASARYDGVLTEEQLACFVKAAPLHDMGKVGIPDHILLKAGKLTPEEWEIMKQHSRIGGEAISHAIDKVLARDLQVTREGISESRSLTFLYTARDIATSHHERWDGTGYPDGLSGEQIPLCARLMAVADVYDALTTRRVYKAAWTHKDAARLILEQKGRQFDPEIVDAFEAIQDTFRQIQERLSDPDVMEG